MEADGPLVLDGSGHKHHSFIEEVLTNWTYCEEEHNNDKWIGRIKNYSILSQIKRTRDA